MWLLHYTCSKLSKHIHLQVHILTALNTHTISLVYTNTDVTYLYICSCNKLWNSIILKSNFAIKIIRQSTYIFRTFYHIMCYVLLTILCVCPCIYVYVYVCVWVCVSECIWKYDFVLLGIMFWRIKLYTGISITERIPTTASISWIRDE